MEGSRGAGVLRRAPLPPCHGRRTMPSRPVLKQSVPFFTAEGAIHFRLAGTLTSLEDPDGRVLALLTLLDGTRELDDICRELQARYPDLTSDDVREAIADLDESRLIQDASDTGS